MVEFRARQKQENKIKNNSRLNNINNSNSIYNNILFPIKIRLWFFKQSANTYSINNDISNSINNINNGIYNMWYIIIFYKEIKEYNIYAWTEKFKR